jgi:hypothetical protein
MVISTSSIIAAFIWRTVSNLETKELDAKTRLGIIDLNVRRELRVAAKTHYWWLSSGDYNGNNS